ncbi:hypothetical protein ACFL35_06385 [Candidatus Riflebacteria bacterium]
MFFRTDRVKLFLFHSIFLILFFQLKFLVGFDMDKPERHFSPSISVFHKKILAFDKLHGDEAEMVGIFFKQRLNLLGISTATDTRIIQSHFFSPFEETRVLAIYHAFGKPPKNARSLMLNVIRAYQDEYTRFFAFKFLKLKYGMNKDDIARKIFKRKNFKYSHPGRENTEKYFRGADKLKKSLDKTEYQAYIENVPILNHRLGVHAKNLYITKFLSLLHSRTGMNFFYRVPVYGFVNVVTADKRLSEILNMALHPLGFDWRYFSSYQIEIIRKKVKKEVSGDKTD